MWRYLRQARAAAVLLGFVAHLYAAQHAAAQSASSGAVPRRPMTTVTVNLDTRRFDKPLPFRESFLLEGTRPEGADSFSVRCTPAESPARDGSTCGTASPRPWRTGGMKGFEVAIGPLSPYQAYRFEFISWKFMSKPGVQVDTLSSESHLDHRTRRRVVTTVVRTTPPPTGARLDTVADTVWIFTKAEADRSTHFDADIGLIWSGRPGYTGLVTNGHVYLVPINKNEDLSVLSTLERLERRVSLVLGLSVRQLHSEASVQPYFDGVGSPMVGLGYRGVMGSESLRVNAGMLLFRQKQANPLVDRDVEKHALAVSGSIDIDLKSLVAPLTLLLK
jgi:hypothetical protein